MSARTQPSVNPTKPGKLPAVLDTTLANGLRVLAARKPGVPMVQARIRFDIARKDLESTVLDDILSSTMLAGTPTRSQLQIAEEMKRLGGEVWASADTESLFVSAISLARDLPAYLALLNDVLQNATHPSDEVDLAKAQAEQGITIMRSQPAAKAQYALGERIFPDHPYGRPMPTPDIVSPVTRAGVRKFHSSVIKPGGALMVVVGDLPPKKMVDAVDKALGGWTGSRKPFKTPTPAPVTVGPLRIVHQPGAVQTNMRLGGLGIGRAHPDFPALTLALTILGGGFTSRLNHNLREDKGFTYGASAGVSHNLAASSLTIGADVQTAVTAPALVETLYEIGRLVTTPVGDAELADAKRFLAGNMALSAETQAGLASYLMSLAIAGLDVSYLRELPLAADKQTPDDIARVAATYLAPTLLAPVLVGDAELIETAVNRLLPVEVIG